MKKYLLVLAVEFVLLCLLYNYLLSRFLPAEKSTTVILVLSVMMLLPAAILNGLAYFFKEISLLRRSENPQLKDGERVALTGYVRALNDILLSPFTRKQCVSYSYKVTRLSAKGSYPQKGRSPQEVLEFAGNVQVPSSLRTNTAEVRLLGLMDGDKTALDSHDPAIVRNAYEYLSNRTFKPKQSLSEAWKGAKAMLTDNDGSVSEEMKSTEQPVELEGRSLQEWCLEISKQYSIIGVWSAAQNGVITDPFGKGAITVLEGDSREAIKAMRKKMGCSILVAVFLIIFLNVFAYIFLTN